MLNIFNDLEPFFEDNYRRINVREYARIRKISAPTASKVLSKFMKEGLLCSEKDRNYIYYRANRENPTFLQLSRAYWAIHIYECGIVDYVEKELANPLIVMFGSLSKAEAREKSDIDIAIIAKSEKKLDLGDFEKKTKRKIHLFVFRNEKDAGSNLISNIKNGIVLSGRWE